MSWVERLGRILSDTVGVGEDGDCGVWVHIDTSGSNNETYKCSEMSYFGCQTSWSSTNHHRPRKHCCLHILS